MLLFYEEEEGDGGRIIGDERIENERLCEGIGQPKLEGKVQKRVGGRGGHRLLLNVFSILVKYIFLTGELALFV